MPDKNAAELIQENLSTRAPFLDLGDCGLTDSSTELVLLVECKHLRILNLGRYYYTGKDESVFTKNGGAHNTFVSVPQSLPLQLEALYMNLTSLKYLQGINRYKALKTIDVFGNYIDSLDGVNKNRNLVSLGLSNNKLTALSKFELFPGLKYLYIGQNEFNDGEIDVNCINKLTRLEELFIYKNGLNSLAFLKGNKSIKWLEIQQNNIGSDDVETLTELVWLETISLGSNPVAKQVPAEISGTFSAVEIRRYFKKCSLPQLLIEENKIKGDVFLDLGFCGLNNSSTELKLLNDSTHLTGLSLGDEYFDEYSNLITSKNNQLPNNRGNKNSFSYIPANLPASLKWLQIRNSNILNISNIDHLVQLELLDLSFNKIVEIGNLGYLKNLYELALHQNNIKYFLGMRLPQSLRILHLSDNKINDLKALQDFKGLEQLILFNNSITEIAPLMALPNLQIINLDKNPIRDCPFEIVISNEIDQIRKYFSGLLAIRKEIKGAKPGKPKVWEDVLLEEEMEKLYAINSQMDLGDKSKPAASSLANDVKLIILGNSNTGKTNLVHYLKTGKFLEKRNSTHGLEVSRWKPDAKRFPGLKNVEVSTWDFGGQEYYHDAYKLFLSNDAVYIIFWSTDSDENIQKPETLKDGETRVLVDHFEKCYWLDTLNYFTAKNINTPILLVQNKVDADADKKRIPQELHDKYGIDESFHISIKQGSSTGNTIAYKNIEFFTDYLSGKLLSFTNAQLPMEVKIVRAEILKLNDNKRDSVFKSDLVDELYITVDRFAAICKDKLGINDTQYYPTWLDKGGTVVYFGNNDNLKEYIFVDPRLLSEKIYSILRLQVLNNKGELKKKEGASAEEKVLIDVMKNLDMLYDHPAKEGYYLAPQYLPEEHPIEDLFTIASAEVWKDSFWIRVPIFFYKKLMHYLLIYFIKDDASKAKYFWKNGIILLKNGKKILIKGLFKTDKEGIIQINVQDGNVALQKEIFKTILDFNIKKDAARTLVNVSEATAASDPYTESLELSVDKINFEKYVYLKKLGDDQAADVDNMLVRYKHILPFNVTGVEPKHVFVSYSHNDASWLKKIKTHLAGLKRGNYIKEWTDQEILPGELWSEKIKEQLEKADIYILLLSADFIASDYSWNTELKEIFTNRLKSGKHIIPVYVEYCDLAALPGIKIEDINKDVKINDFEMVPKDDTEHLKPISIWANEAQALSVVAAKIRQVVMQAKPAG